MKRVTIGLCLVTALTFSLALGASIRSRGNLNPGVIPPTANPYGMSYGDWSAAWWEWVIQYPAAVNPILDPDGTCGSQGQSGPVWFLAGNGGGSVERALLVPAGKALFFPLVNGSSWAPDDLAFAAEFAETAGLDSGLMTDEELIYFLLDALLAHDPFDDSPIVTMSCAVDGQDLGDLEGYRVQSEPFEPEAADGPTPYPYFDWVTQPQDFFISDGYWIMLAPLSAGQHTIHFTATINHGLWGGFALDVTYHLRVGPPAVKDVTSTD